MARVLVLWLTGCVVGGTAGWLIAVVSRLNPDTALGTGALVGALIGGQAGYRLRNGEQERS